LVGLSFFDESARPVEPPPRQRRPRWVAPPENELGSVVPISLVLARTDELALVLSFVVAYSTGFALRLGLRLHPDAAIDPRSFMPLHGRPWSGEEPLRFGVEFSDGLKATNLGPRRPPAEGEPPITLTMNGGGGGGGLSFDFSYWVSPLPPPDKITFAVAWPSRAISETQRVLDTAPILEAAALSEQLWEDNRPVGGGGGAPIIGAGGGGAWQSLSAEKP